MAVLTVVQQLYSLLQRSVDGPLALSINEQVDLCRWLNPTSEADPLPDAGFCLPVKSIILRSLPIQRFSSPLYDKVLALQMSPLRLRARHVP
jgi:hypothetical protein